MEINWELKHYTELSAQELYALLQLRAEVFVVEQNCPYQDIDGKDEKSFHLMGWTIGVEKTLIAYARIVAPGVSYPECSIGRVVTKQTHRMEGFGIELMKRAIDGCYKKFGENSIRISAQKYLQKFYTNLGFEATGKEYLEDNIPHIEMLLEK